MIDREERLQRWLRFLSSKRVDGDDEDNADRSEFSRDFDRIIFSSAFRRMQDKTQVFPLSTTDFTRTRLTHSLEVACVGRTLGNWIGQHLTEFFKTDQISHADVGTIVAAACIAHDIGNPPFGHSGEEAFAQWARKNLANASQITTDASRKIEPASLADLLSFEGNAQGFRSMVRHLPKAGGISFTVAVLAATMKYPRPADFPAANANNVAHKKFSYFQAERKFALKVFAETGMPCQLGVEDARGRHPLAFLVEAADDICNRIVDLEDAYKRKLVTLTDVDDFLRPLAEKDPLFKQLPMASYPDDVQVYKYRASAIKALAIECRDVFRNGMDVIETGQFKSALINFSVAAGTQYEQFKEKMRKTVYASPEVAQIEAAGFKVIGGLLDMFAKALIFDPTSKESQKIALLLPKQYLEQSFADKDVARDRLLERMPAAYDRMLAVTDFICGMTDRYAVELFQKLSGISVG